MPLHPQMEVSMRILASLLTLVLTIPGVTRAQADDRPPGPVMAEVVESIEALDRMRSRLAATIADADGAVDRTTFANVCRPVGRQAMELSSENPWTVQQMAVRYRNPAHEADPEARGIHGLLEQEPGVEAVWIRSRRDGVQGYRYLRRITVERSCLACHGAAQDRPAFVRDQYPHDRAFGFEAGDLRGVYSVVVPVDSPEG